MHTSVLRTQGISQADLHEEVREYFSSGATVKPDDIVLDVGANIGAFAWAAAQQVNGDLQVHCFEPAAPTFHILQENFRNNPLLRQTQHTVNCLALTHPDQAGSEREFHFFRHFPTDSTYDFEQKNQEFEAFFRHQADEIARALAAKLPLVGRPLGRAIRALIRYVCNRENRFGVWLSNLVTGRQILICRTDSLENWVRTRKLPRIDLLKIDVEGAEVDVLEGAGAIWPLIQQVAIETHDRAERIRGIQTLLQTHGFSRIEQIRPQVAHQSGLNNVLIIARRTDGNA